MHKELDILHKHSVTHFLQRFLGSVSSSKYFLIFPSFLNELQLTEERDGASVERGKTFEHLFFATFLLFIRFFVFLQTWW
jgi:hypothetical protein